MRNQDGAQAQTLVQQRIGRDLEAQVQDAPRSGQLSVYACPECGGVLWETHGQEDLLSFQCHTGHTVPARELIQRKSVLLEGLLGSSLRTVIEKRTLVRQLAVRLPADATPEQRARMEEMERLDEQSERALRQMLEAWPNPSAQGYIVQEVLEEGA